MPRTRVRLFGYPLHPTLVVFPMALFPLSFLFDAAAIATLDPFWWRAARWIIAAGILGTMAAVVAGLFELSSVPDGPPRRLANHHALMGGTILALYTVVLMLHVRDVASAPLAAWTALSMNLAGQFLLAFQGVWGGWLVYRHRVGVGDRMDPS